MCLFRPPVAKRYLVNDATVEKLGELLNHNPNGLLLLLRIELVQLDRRRELPIDQPFEIGHHSVHEFPERPKGARLLRRLLVMGVPGEHTEPCFAFGPSKRENESWPNGSSRATMILLTPVTDEETADGRTG